MVNATHNGPPPMCFIVHHSTTHNILSTYIDIGISWFLSKTLIKIHSGKPTHTTQSRHTLSEITAQWDMAISVCGVCVCLSYSVCVRVHQKCRVVDEVLSMLLPILLSIVYRRAACVFLAHASSPHIIHNKNRKINVIFVFNLFFCHQIKGCLMEYLRWEGRDNRDSRGRRTRLAIIALSLLSTAARLSKQNVKCCT